MVSKKDCILFGTFGIIVIISIMMAENMITIQNEKTATDYEKYYRNCQKACTYDGNNSIKIQRTHLVYECIYKHKDGYFFENHTADKIDELFPLVHTIITSGECDCDIRWHNGFDGKLVDDPSFLILNEEDIINKSYYGKLCKVTNDYKTEEFLLKNLEEYYFLQQ